MSSHICPTGSCCRSPFSANWSGNCSCVLGQQRGGLAAPPERHEARRPADDACVLVEHDRYVEPALRRPDLSEICNSVLPPS
jgi:hypothetical protein